MTKPYDFIETRDTITLVFYKGPREDNHLEFILKDPTTCVYGEQLIKLYMPVHTPVIVSNKYKREVTLRKVEQVRWSSVNGPSRQKIIVDSRAYSKEEQKPSSLMDMLRNIYERSPSDVKKAMNKSMSESGGTVLSTNWEDVKQRTVKPEE